MQLIKKNRIKEIITALKNGAVLVLPTDTVYGLVCDAGNKKAVGKIFKIKKRPKTKPLAIFVKDIKMVKRYAKIDKHQEDVLKKSWPGAVTFVLKAKLGLAKPVYKKNTIGVRIPDYNLIKKIFKKFDKPLAQTSANVSGKKALTNIAEIKSQFKNEDILIVDAGNLSRNKPSKVIDLRRNKTIVLRK